MSLDSWPRNLTVESEQIGVLPSDVDPRLLGFQIHLHDRPIRDYRGSVPTAAERVRVATLHRGLMAHGIITAPSLMGCLSTPMGEPEIDAFVDAFVAAAREG